MSVDKFGRYSQRKKHKVNFQNTLDTKITAEVDNSLNVHFNRIKNLKDPILNEDAVTKSFVEKTLNEYQNAIQKNSAV